MNNQTSSLEFYHFPVMLNEVLKISPPSSEKKFIDCTFGGGGYSKAILNFPKTKVQAIDRDKKALLIAKDLERKFPKRAMQQQQQQQRQQQQRQQQQQSCRKLHRNYK